MFGQFRSGFGGGLFNDEFISSFFDPNFDPFARRPSMESVFNTRASAPQARIICIEVLEALHVLDSNVSFVTPSLIEPIEDSDEESIDEEADDDMEGISDGTDDHLTIHDITGQDFYQNFPENKNYIVDPDGYASDEEDNDEVISNNNNNSSPNIDEMKGVSEQSSVSESQSDSESATHRHRYKHEHEHKADKPRHHVKRELREERYFEDNSRHRKRSKTEKSTMSDNTDNNNNSNPNQPQKWDWTQNKFV